MTGVEHIAPSAAPRGASPAAPAHPEIGVLALLLDPWGPRWMSRHHVLTRLARHFHVVWLNPALEWRAALRAGRLRARETLVPGQPASFVVRDASPWSPVLYRPAWARAATLRARLAAGRASLVRRGCTRIVLYVWHPSFADALDAVPHDLSVYHIYDEYSHAEREQPLDPAEERLIRTAGVVITLSPTMQARKGALSRHSVQIPNGVDFEAAATPVPEPSDLAAVPRPRIGYAGFIKQQLDWELLDALASRHPDWSFVFVGARSAQPELPARLARIAARPNVHFLGAKSSAELARYPQHFDVSVMPYRVNDYTKYISPLKLYEYLAAGQPVVSVPLPGLGDAASLVSVAEGPAAWERAIAAALSPDAQAASQRAARQQEARRNDWALVAERIADRIVRALDHPPTTP